MRNSRICEVFALYAQISIDETMDYMPIINAIKSDIESHLICSDYADTKADILDVLCAVRVYYNYLLSKSAESSDTSIKVGGVSSSAKTSSNVSEKIKYAKMLCDKYEIMTAELFCDTEFLFGSV